jgi:hypothetical protein
MSVLAQITNFVGGSLFKEIKDGITAYFPPDMTPQQKAEAELKVQQMLNDKQREAEKMLTSAANQLDKRIAAQEGTAKDLLALPILGRLMLFLRGVQRPTWGFATLYMDYKWFFDASSNFSEQQELALTVINLLVLGFLFGERTVKNLEPLILKIFDRVLK